MFKKVWNWYKDYCKKSLNVAGKVIGWIVIVAGFIVLLPVFLLAAMIGIITIFAVSLYKAIGKSFQEE